LGRLRKDGEISEGRENVDTDIKGMLMGGGERVLL